MAAVVDGQAQRFLVGAGQVAAVAALHEQRHLARHRKRGHLQAEQRQRRVQGEDMALHVGRVQRVEDRVLCQQVEHAAAGVQIEALAFAHRQQAGDMVDLAAGQQHGLDRGMAQVALRPQRRGRQQLLAEIGRGVDQQPALVVGADRNAGLGATLGTRKLLPCPQARRRMAVPLRVPPAGRRSQYDEVHPVSVYGAWPVTHRLGNVADTRSKIAGGVSVDFRTDADLANHGLVPCLHCNASGRFEQLSNDARHSPQTTSARHAQNRHGLDGCCEFEVKRSTNVSPITLG